MKVLVACEFSGIVRDAFARRGHDAWSCDILETEAPGNHLRGDARLFLGLGWDLLIAHPPCTYLSNSGVRWLHSEGASRWLNLAEGASLFRDFLQAPIGKIAVENPIPHKYAKALIGQPYSQVVQPWQFGHGETKATCLWLKQLDPLRPSSVVSGREAKIHRAPPGPLRWKFRSLTFFGIAEAMAEQWGGDLTNQSNRPR